MYVDIESIAKELEVTREYVTDVIVRLEHNETISEYFEKLYDLTGRDRYLALADEVFNCHNLFTCDKHPRTKLVDIVHIQLCHNRFCANCQKMIQATRFDRFLSTLLETSETKDLYHMVLTVPNVSGASLRNHISIMFSAFARLVRFFRGTDRIKGVDLKPLGFTAALRALEVTFNTKRRDYHPHLHCIVAFEKGLSMPKHHRNKFSYDYEGGRRIFKRQFSDFELFVQKLWRLLLDQIAAGVYKFREKLTPVPRHDPAAKLFSDRPLRKAKNSKADAVTLEAISRLGPDDGYSVILDPVENGHFVQVFKYAFKLQSEDAQLMNFEQFRTILEALNGRKTIQGYGDWFNMKPDDAIDESMNEFLDVFKAYLWQIDRPESVNYSAQDLLALVDDKEYRVITRRKLHKTLEELTESDLMRHSEEIPAAPARKFSPPDLCRSYYRYLKHKRESDLFADVRKVEIPDSADKLIVLSAEQMSFLTSIFA